MNNIEPKIDKILDNQEKLVLDLQIFKDELKVIKQDMTKIINDLNDDSKRLMIIDKHIIYLRIGLVICFCLLFIIFANM